MRSFRGASQAMHRSAMIHRVISHQVAVHSQSMQRGARAAFLAVADIVVYEIGDALVHELGLSTNARRIVLSRGSQAHIRSQRQIASDGDAQLAADRLHEAFQDLRAVEADHPPFGCKVIGRVGSQDRSLVIVLKAVPAHKAQSGQDELWVSTSYPLGRRRGKIDEAEGKWRPLKRAV